LAPILRDTLAVNLNPYLAKHLVESRMQLMLFFVAYLDGEFHFPS